METTAVQSTKTSIDLLNAQNQAKGGKKSLGADDFMKLLTVQLSSQDPLKPMEDTAFIAQMASFTSLEQMRTLTTNFDTFAKDQKLTEANSYLGKAVTVTDSTGTDVSGLVSGISINAGTPQILLNGKTYDLTAIKTVTSNTPATATAVSTPSPTPTVTQIGSAPNEASTDTTKGTN